MSRLLELKRQYIDWLTESMDYKEISSNVIRIDTPFLDNDLDDIVLYVELLDNRKIIVTDDGYTINNLKSLGLNISKKTKKNRSILENICVTYGIEFNESENELLIKTDFDKFAVSKHRLLEAILKINDIYYLRTTQSPNKNFEKIANTLEEHEILYSSNTPVIGRSGITIVYDFIIPTRKKEDKLVRIINTPNNLNQTKIFGMDATLSKYTKKAKYFSLLDDVSQDLNKYDEILAINEEVSTENGIAITSIKLSELENKVELLAN